MVRALAPLFLAALLAGCSSAPPPMPAQGTGVQLEAHFDRVPPGPLAGFDVRSGAWSVAEDPSAPSAPNVLEANGTGLVLAPTGTYGDADHSIRFLAARSGAQALGLVVGHDGTAFDLARVDVRAARVEVVRMNGTAEQPLRAAEGPVAAGAWHTLALRVRGGAVEVSLDGRAGARRL